MNFTLSKLILALGATILGGTSSVLVYKMYQYSKEEIDGSAYKNYEKKVMINTVFNRAAANKLRARK